MIRRHPWGGLADPSVGPPADVVILGLPYEGGACWRGGAAEAPRRLREISSSSPAISETGRVVDPSRLRVKDTGDILPEAADEISETARERYFARIEAAVADTLRAAAAGRSAFLLALGGDHSVNIPLVRGFRKAFADGYGLISLDAHPDLFDTYDGSSLSAACPLRRALDGGRLKPEHVMILGTRSYNRLEIDFMKNRGIHFVPAREIDRIGVDTTVAMASARLRGVGGVYMTVDIDVADPSCAPGTGAPVAGGLSSRQFLDLARVLLETLPVRAMDLVEISPRLDPTDATLFLGLQLIFEGFAVLAERSLPSS